MFAIRFFIELFKPTVKCGRIGHKQHERTRRTIRWPSETRRGVADSCREKSTKCRRCGKTMTDWEVFERDEINSLSMSQTEWDKLKDNGFIID